VTYGAIAAQASSVSRWLRPRLVARTPWFADVPTESWLCEPTLRRWPVARRQPARQKNGLHTRHSRAPPKKPCLKSRP